MERPATRFAWNGDLALAYQVIGEGVPERHHAHVRALLERHRGVEVDTAGDGFFATFDGPARAIQCARAIVEAVRPLGIEVRAGLHTGSAKRSTGRSAGSR